MQARIKLGIVSEDEVFPTQDEDLEEEKDDVDENEISDNEEIN